MHLNPRLHRCARCGHEERLDPDDAPPVADAGGFLACPACWQSFLRGAVGELRPVEDATVRRGGARDADLSSPGW